MEMSSDNEDVDGGVVMIDVSNKDDEGSDVMMMMKVEASYRKKGDSNIRAESAYVPKFDDTCNSSSTMHKLL